MRVPDLFAPRDVPVGQSVRVAADGSARPTKTGPSDDELLALSAAGLTLRRIARRVGLSHETVRSRLARSRAVGGVPTVDGMAMAGQRATS